LLPDRAKVIAPQTVDRFADKANRKDLFKEFFKYGGDLATLELSVTRKSRKAQKPTRHWKAIKDF